MLLWLATGGYSMAWLTSARYLFRRWRSIPGPLTCDRDHEVSRHGGYNHFGSCCVDDAHQATTTDTQAAALAMFTSLGWPLVLVTALVRCEPLTALRKLHRNPRIWSFTSRPPGQPGTTITLRDPAWERDMEDKLGIPRD
jgi:hypothetical protein